MRNVVLIVSIVTLVSACIIEVIPPPPINAVSVFPLYETTPVTSSGDAADDPAIWINSTSIDDSLVIGTDKDSGVEVYRLNGERVQSLPIGRTNNIDLRYLTDDERWSAIAAASNRSTNSISLFAIDHDGTLVWLESSEIVTGLTEPYGTCMYSSENGLQVFVNDTDGRYQQWGLRRISSPTDRTLLPQYSAQLLREFSVPSQPEGCVVDDVEQRLFLGVEAEGIRYTSAIHTETPRLSSIADIDGEILVADVEGMGLYTTNDSGYLVVSSQGNYSYAIYDRRSPFNYRGSFIVAAQNAESLDGSQETDGLAVSSRLRTAEYPQGLLVVQDGFNTQPQEAQNFKFVSWLEIAQSLGL